MNLYLDTGFFIDYLASRGHLDSGLRSASRRGRLQDDLFKDAEQLLERVRRNPAHSVVTSALTYYEVEEALYKQLAKATKGVSKASTLLVPIARSIVIQMITVVRYCNISVVDLKASVVDAQCREHELGIRGIRAADSLHVVTAILQQADVLVSTDAGVLSLDGVFETSQGKKLRCLDSDDALGLI